MDTSILEDIGLTGAETKVFISLLELGPSNAGKVVEKTSLQNSVVHRAFHSLIEKGLVSYVLEGKIKKYQTIKPKMLLNFLDEKKARIQKILPELELKQKRQEEKPRATIFEGIRGVKELINLILETKSKDYYILGGTIKSNHLLGEYFWDNFHRKRIEKKIKGKLLFHNSLKNWGKELNKRKLTHVKYTDREFEELTETLICGNKVAILIYLEKPFGFLIEEISVANSYKKLFELLWKTSK